MKLKFREILRDIIAKVIITKFVSRTDLQTDSPPKYPSLQKNQDILKRVNPSNTGGRKY